MNSERGDLSVYSDRSILYSLEPIKKGTPFVESISSYICRLAFEHNLDVATLLFKVIIPNIQGDSSYKVLHSLTKTHTFLGVGQTAFKIVDALEFLTARKDLHELTLLNWKPIMRVALISKKKKWCSQCFREMGQRQEIYEPLIWQLREANTCLKHAVPFSRRCWKCNKEIPHIRTGMVIGYCPFCKCFLGEKVDRPFMNLRIIPRKEERLLKVYSDLLTNNRPLEVPTYNYIQNLIKKIRFTNPHISNKHFSSVLSIEEEMLMRVLLGISKPNIIFWGEICNFFDVTLSELLGGKLQDEKLKEKMGKIKNRGDRKTLDEKTLRKMHEALIIYIDEVTSLTLFSYAKQNKHDQRRLRTHFPDLYKSAIAKSKKIQEEEKKNRYINIEKKIRTYILLQKEPVSLKSIVKKFGITKPTLMRYLPELYLDIKESYASYKLKRDCKNKEEWIAELREIISELYEEGIYPSASLIMKKHSNRALFRDKKYCEERIKIMNEFGYDV